MDKATLLKALKEYIDEAMELNDLDEYDDYIRGMLDLVSYVEGNYDNIVIANTPIGELLGETEPNVQE